MSLPKIDPALITGKKVFVRVDIDVPLKDGQVSDDTRLKDIWPTIELLLNSNCNLILAGHLGRPEGKVTPELSSWPVAQWITSRMQTAPPNIQAVNLGNFHAFKIADNIALLENLRFDEREEGSDEDYAKELAALAEIYVNESFASAERAHASVVGVPKLLPHFAGLRLAQEVEVLTNLLENPARPMVAAIGGAKLETKLPVINKLAGVADAVIVGGKLLCETGEMQFSSKVHLLKLTEDEKDVVQNSVDSCGSMLELAKTIVWNGPFGMIEDFTYQVGTRRLAEIIASNDTAYKVVGGGDSVGFLDKLGLTDKFQWVSSGGGSMLKILAGEKLPGVEVLFT